MIVLPLNLERDGQSGHPFFVVEELIAGRLTN